eukprot:634289-Prorocentrum_minimum.AAC.7
MALRGTKGLQELAGGFRVVGFRKLRPIAQVRPDGYCANVRRAHAFEFSLMIGRINKEVDRKRWLMAPQSLNYITSFYGSFCANHGKGAPTTLTLLYPTHSAGHAAGHAADGVSKHTLKVNGFSC